MAPEEHTGHPKVAPQLSRVNSPMSTRGLPDFPSMFLLYFNQQPQSRKRNSEKDREQARLILPRRMGMRKGWAHLGTLPEVWQGERGLELDRAGLNASATFIQHCAPGRVFKPETKCLSPASRGHCPFSGTLAGTG